MLDEIDNAANIDALKTRSLPAFLRPKPRPLSTEDDLQQLYAKVRVIYRILINKQLILRTSNTQQHLVPN